MTNRIRLRATEPVAGASQAARFTKIFEPIPIWIARGSKIITDFSIDKERLHRLGYSNIQQCNMASKRQDQTNSQVMDFLKRVVPKMFQVHLFLHTIGFMLACPSVGWGRGKADFMRVD